MEDRPPAKGARSGHTTHLNFGGHKYIFGMAEATVVKFCIQVGYIKC